MKRVDGPTVVVTGATSGIGLAAAGQFAALGLRVIGVGRSPDRCRLAEDEVRSLSPAGRVEFLAADLSLQSQALRLAGEIHSRVACLDALVNNAGTVPFWQEITAEGLDMQFAVNHLAAFRLTHELLPLLQAARMARVVTVSSGSHYRARLDWDDIQSLRRYNVLRAYKRTKLCNVLFTAHLNHRLGANSTVRAFAADPGLVKTGIGSKSNSILARWAWSIRRLGGITPDESARGIVFLATEPSIQGAKEIYWKHCHPKAPDPYVLDEDAARRLWEVSARMCGIEA
ncbi:MAG: SDR family NAD(P)-dependent oxidoreductase [Chloroflexi bacterium]|nr:SDR family NAD(P)-dependent oxidoreductase [Chloroflexota bacterium]